MISLVDVVSFLVCMRFLNKYSSQSPPDINPRRSGRKALNHGARSHEEERLVVPFKDLCFSIFEFKSHDWPINERKLLKPQQFVEKTYFLTASATTYRSRISKVQLFKSCTLCTKTHKKKHGDRYAWLENRSCYIFVTKNADYKFLKWRVLG